MDERTMTIPVVPDDLRELERKPPRKLRGLRMPVLPTGSWLAQVGGGIATLGGTYLQFGFAVTLITGGVAALVLGALREAGKV
jgi:hypothetical protein